MRWWIKEGEEEGRTMSREERCPDKIDHRPRGRKIKKKILKKLIEHENKTCDVKCVVK